MLYFLLFVLFVCTYSHHEDPSTLPAHALATCFAHTIDASQINQCVTQKNVPNCNRLHVSVSGTQSYEACACNLTVSDGVDVGYVFDSAPSLNDKAIDGGSIFNAKTWWESLNINIQTLTENILKGDSRVTVYSSYSNVNGEKTRSITKGLISPNEYFNLNVPYHEFACPNFDAQKPPCQSRSYTCEAIKRAMDDLNAVGNENRRKVLFIFWINEAQDLNDCLKMNIFKEKRSDLSIVNIAASLTVDDKEWTGGLRDQMLQVASGVTDSFIFNNGFFKEIRDRGEKKCGETRYVNALLLRKQKVLSDDLLPFLCTIYPNPIANEVFWVRDLEQNFFRLGLALISDHLCLQTPLPSTSSSPTTSSPSTSFPTTSRPSTLSPLTSKPTSNPSKSPSTSSPSTSSPSTSSPTTSRPSYRVRTPSPNTSNPTKSPTTLLPTTSNPSTSSPLISHDTMPPTSTPPTTSYPSRKRTKSPSKKSTTWRRWL